MTYRNIILALLLTCFLSAPAFADTKPAATAPAMPSAPWSIRCQTPEKGKEAAAPKNCEMFQRLAVQKTGQRVAEFAIGLPGGKDQQKGAVILPLGILATEDVSLQIDDGRKFKFRISYCTQEGCFAFIDTNRTLIDALSTGKFITVTAKAYTNQDVVIKMSLDGFAKAYNTPT